MKGKKFSKSEMTWYITEINVKSYVTEFGIFHEEFKQICYKGKYIPYIISSFGRVFSTNYHNSGKVKQLKTALRTDGYELVNIKYQKKMHGMDCHRLVALHFIPNKNKKENTDVNHIDGVKTHNYYWNLEWCTHHENIKHAWANNLHPTYCGDKSSHHKFTSEDVRKVCELIERGYRFKEIAQLTNVSYHMIKKIYAKNNWTEISDEYNFSNYKYGKK